MKKNLLSLVAITVLSTASLANDVRVGGFINVVAGIADNGGYKNYDKNYNFSKESLAAIQFSGTISDNMGATIQLIAQNSELDDNIRLEWGFVHYDVSDEFRVLAGRIRPALYLYSDYIDVGYAYTWITPPSEVYDQVQISNIDGVSANYNHEIGDNEVTFSGFTGTTNYAKTIPSGVLDLDYDNILGGEVAFIHEYFKLRAGYIQVQVTDYKALIKKVGLTMNEVDVSFAGVGINIDYENILFASEYTMKSVDGTGSADETAYYAMLGYKMGDFTPSYTYAVAQSDMEFATTYTEAKNKTANEARAKNLDDRYSHTIGLRYDLNAKSALKLEYNRATKTRSTYVSGTTLKETEKEYNTFRVALNTVY